MVCAQVRIRRTGVCSARRRARVAPQDPRTSQAVAEMVEVHPRHNLVVSLVLVRFTSFRQLDEPVHVLHERCAATVGQHSEQRLASTA